MDFISSHPGIIYFTFMVIELVAMVVIAVSLVCIAISLKNKRKRP